MYSPEIVLFDLGDVIAGFDPAPRVAEYARRAGLPRAEVLERLATDDFWERTDRGDFTAAEMQEQLCGLLGCEFSRAELLALQAAAFAVRSEVVEIAEEISKRVRVGILTNNAPLLEEAFPIHFPELVRAFDPLLFSFQFGHTKPDPRLFEAVQAHLGLPPSRIFFIDDKQSHVEAAQSLGWEAVRYEATPGLRAALTSRRLC